MPAAIDALEVGQTLPSSEWMLIDQSRVNRFADATGDHQWIHVDEARCQAESPFGGTIAHGYLTTTVMPGLFYNMVSIDPGKQTLLNYGVDTLRFLEPVRSGDRIRYHVKLDSIKDKPSGRLYRFACEVEIEGRDTPAMVGQFLMLLVNAPN